jgi:hypothetical protein
VSFLCPQTLKTVILATYIDHDALSAAMDATTRRRRHRRRPDRPPLSASLLVDDRIKDDVGLVENQLFGALFPWAQKGVSLIYECRV